MKQRITVEQLNELSDDQSVQLRKWWIPQKGEHVLREYDNQVYIAVRTYDGPAQDDLTRWFVGLDNHAGISNKDCLPLLSIGQMFQLLNDDRQSDVPVPISQILPNYHLYYTDSLCDVLWGAVKEILKDTPTP